ncbi:hypothetical protein BDZ97DRAFT_1814652 [Flammula alnicola]|nr:hypothetical protein BDZ97DRAFT_1814652 [Flammula alnicola]
MIISSKKYACETCIKGHRSSACKHTDRPLFEIKKKGRPVTQCEHCRELRKTKQVHVKCICETKSESSSPEGIKPGFETAAFPNGLPLGAPVAFPNSGEGTSSDSDHGGVHHSHQCKFGDPCTCVMPRTRNPARGGSTEQPLNAAVSGGSSRRANIGHASSSKASAHTSSQILARIQELRPLVPRPPSQGAYPMSGPVHNPSMGVPHGHATGRHLDSFAPYGRVHGMTPHTNVHPQSYVASPGPSNSLFSYNEQTYNDQLQMMGAPPAWGSRSENVGFDSSTFPSLCGCGDDCACPGCIHHNRGTAVPSSSAYASCSNPNHCATCLDCTIMSLPASAILPPDTALSIYDDSQNNAIDEWLRQMSASNFSDNTPHFHQGFPPNDGPFQQQPSSGWGNRGFPFSNQPSNMSRDPRSMPPSGFNNYDSNGQSMMPFNPPSDRGPAIPNQPRHRSQASMSSHDPTIDPRLLPSNGGGMMGGPFLTLPNPSRSRSPSTSSQSSHHDQGSDGNGGRIPPYRPSGRVQGMFNNSQGVRSAPQLNIHPNMARAPSSASSSSISPSPGSGSSTRPPYASSVPTTASSEYDPSLAGLQIY